MVTVRKWQQTIYGLLGRISPTMLGPYMATISATNCRTKLRSSYPRLNTLKIYSQNKNIVWNYSTSRVQG